MNLPLIIACIVIVLGLIIFPLIVSHKAEKHDNLSDECDFESSHNEYIENLNQAEDNTDDLNRRQ